MSNNSTGIKKYYCSECNKILPKIQQKIDTTYSFGARIEIIDVISKTCTYCGKKQKVDEIIIFSEKTKDIEEYYREKLKRNG